MLNLKHIITLCPRFSKEYHSFNSKNKKFSRSLIERNINFSIQMMSYAGNIQFRKSIRYRLSIYNVLRTLLISELWDQKEMNFIKSQLKSFRQVSLWNRQKWSLMLVILMDQKKIHNRF